MKADEAYILSKKAISNIGTSTGIKNNLTATKAPTVVDDSSKGYEIGSTWIFGGAIYECIDATKATAKWVSSTDVFYSDDWDGLVALISVVGTTYLNKFCTVTNANGAPPSGTAYIAPSSIINPISDGGSATYKVNAQGSTYSVTCQKRTITNPILTSIQTIATTKPIVAGYYAFTVTPTNGLPIGCNLGDICYYDGATWSRFQSYSTANGVVLVGTTLATQVTWKKQEGTWVNSYTNDKSSSKYFDIGNMRIQWGTSGSGNANPDIIFPAPFKDTSYSFTATVNGTSYLYSVMNGSKTTTRINIAKKFYNAGGIGGASGEAVDWQAIGLKP